MMRLHESWRIGSYGSIAYGYWDLAARQAPGQRPHWQPSSRVSDLGLPAGSVEDRPKSGGYRRGQAPRAELIDLGQVENVFADTDEPCTVRNLGARV